MFVAIIPNSNCDGQRGQIFDFFNVIKGENFDFSDVNLQTTNFDSNQFRSSNSDDFNRFNSNPFLDSSLDAPIAFTTPATPPEFFRSFDEKNVPRNNPQSLSIAQPPLPVPTSDVSGGIKK